MTGQHAASGAGAGPGWWPSPFDGASVAAGKVSRSGLQRHGGALYWTEGRPDLGGRQVVVRAERGGVPTVVSPAGVSVRSRVHEYGGAAVTLDGDRLYYVDQDDQRWYRWATSTDGSARPPSALTPLDPDAGVSVRHADGRATPSGRWLVSVEERVAEGGTGHRLVAVATDGSQVVRPLFDGTDFVAAPRPSPDGRWLAWVSWNHPSMPWDSSEVRIAPLQDGADGTIGLGEVHRVAGGDGCSVGQPRWCRDGSLVFMDDRTGWWLPYRLAVDRLDDPTAADPLVDLTAEFHAPDWALGQSTVDELPDGSLVLRMHRDGLDHLVRLVPPPGGDGVAGPPGGGGGAWSLEEVDQPCVSITGVVADGDDAGWRSAVLGSTPTEAQAVFEVPVTGRGATVRRSTPPALTVPGGDVAVARPFVAVTPGGPVPGQFFAPANSRAEADVGRPPPLVVFCHGGPTGSAEPGFDPVVQFFTSRGLAVATVDYRGSSGYGRAYRSSLDGRWGEADVDDCVGYASALVDAGLVDGDRMAIRGTSAGGFTALAALVRSDRFAGAAAWYGVTDLEALAADTHDFEARYVDSLIGPWPEAAATYRERSPIHHPDGVTGSVLLLQGADDRVVPADQSERFAAELRRHGVPCRLTVFEGESHGFRRADTIEASLGAELGFYRSLFADGDGDGA